MSENQDALALPKWDVALEALAREESKKLSRPLQIDDFLRLAREHAIRFDDIMVTMFELALNREWIYSDSAGIKQELTRDEINALYVNGRLHDKDVQGYDGFWEPART